MATSAKNLKVKSASNTKPAAKKSAAKKSGAPKLLSSKLVYKGKVFNVFSDTLVEPNGHKHSRDVIRHNGSVVMLPSMSRPTPPIQRSSSNGSIATPPGSFCSNSPLAAANPTRHHWPQPSAS
jgi:hypothetical protein